MGGGRGEGDCKVYVWSCFHALRSNFNRWHTCFQSRITRSEVLAPSQSHWSGSSKWLVCLMWLSIYLQTVSCRGKQNLGEIPDEHCAKPCKYNELFSPLWQGGKKSEPVQIIACDHILENVCARSACVIWWCCTSSASSVKRSVSWSTSSRLTIGKTLPIHKEKLKESSSQETPAVGMYTGGSLAHLHCESQSINWLAKVEPQEKRWAQAVMSGRPHWIASSGFQVCRNRNNSWRWLACACCCALWRLSFAASHLTRAICNSKARVQNCLSMARSEWTESCLSLRLAHQEGFKWRQAAIAVWSAIIFP